MIKNYQTMCIYVILFKKLSNKKFWEREKEEMSNFFCWTASNLHMVFQIYELEITYVQGYTKC